jgi:poly(hydroxyalkanoate) depolymerase family esterase
MHNKFHELLREATGLTRTGDLQAATRAIQEALGASSGRHGHEGDVIDVEAREVPGDGQAALPPAEGAAPAPQAHPRSEAQPPAVQPAAAPEPAAFVAGRSGGTGLAGRDYKLFVPAGVRGAPMPLVVMLHGCTQDPDDFAAGTRMNELAQAQGFCVLYPAQSQRANPQRCWNWFKPSHQERGRGEPHIVAGMVREVMAAHAIDPARVYVAGLSAGGAMAAVLAAAYPDLFAAVGVHSGLAPGAAHDVQSALEAMKSGARRKPRPLPVPAIVFHGEADGTVHPANGTQVGEAAAGVSNAGESVEVLAGGPRKVTRRVVRDREGATLVEHWSVQGLPHAWSGGSARGSYTDPAGPDASAEMLRFFLEHPRRGA